MKPNSKNCVFVSPVNYYGLKQRHQAIANKLKSSGYNIKFINPVKSPGFSIRTSKPQKKFRLIDINIPFRASSHPILQRLSSFLTLKLLNKLPDIQAEQSLLWIAEPSLSEFTNYKWKHIVYDRCDLHGAFPGQNKSAWETYESLIFSNVDLVFYSHPSLKKSIPQNIRSRLVPNAANINWQNKTRSKLAKPLKFISAGAHFEWTDFSWLSNFAEFSDIELNIAGPGRGKDFSNLIKNSNVRYHGILSHNDLHKLMLQCHVGLIPFKDIILTEAVDPIKAYEYASCGLAIVSPDIKGLSENSLVDYKFSNFENISTLIAKLEFFSCKKKVIPTWDDRAKTILDTLCELE